jgi:hypothetical protein
MTNFNICLLLIIVWFYLAGAFITGYAIVTTGFNRFSVSKRSFCMATWPGAVVYAIVAFVYYEWKNPARKNVRYGKTNF